MSFRLTVLTRAVPDDLVHPWISTLGAQGLDVEIYPSFKPSTWRGGFLPFKVSVRPGAFPTAGRYGALPLLGGFELDFGDPESDDLEKAASESPDEIARLLRNSRVEAAFRTAMGRTVLDFRLQSFGAATLAVLTDGVLFDGQQGSYFSGSDALANAARESDGFDAAPVHEHDWDLPQFPGWQVLGG